LSEKASEDVIGRCVFYEKAISVVASGNYEPKKQASAKETPQDKSWYFRTDIK
jgi:hypothetical protein